MKSLAKKVLELTFEKSLRKAVIDQGLDLLFDKLKEIVPDIKNQYSTFLINNSYLQTKVRCQHAFQISLVDKIINKFEKPVIVDIGDSSGTHLQYITVLYSKNKNINGISINLDPEAVERITKKGLRAIHTRVEDLHNYNICADIFLCFEIIEHLMDPCRFLHELSIKTNAKYLIMTVPYMKKSRVGLDHIRNKQDTTVNAENTHIFELNPDDWKLIVRHSGWNVVIEKIYLQYPKYSLLRLAKPLWKKFDYEGFYGLILERDSAWSSKYLSWE